MQYSKVWGVPHASLTEKQRGLEGCTSSAFLPGANHSYVVLLYLTSQHSEIQFMHIYRTQLLLVVLAGVQCITWDDLVLVTLGTL